MDIAAWLRGLSLERYAGAFRDNAIEMEVLPELIEADLEKVGVLLVIAKSCSRQSPRSGRRRRNPCPSPRQLFPPKQSGDN